jgi:hypothetical protein
MRQTLAKCWEQNIDVHNLFIDYQAAYDTVWRKEIRSEMHKIGPPLPPPPRKNRSSCRILNNEVDVKVKIGKYHLNLKLKKV